MSEQPLDLKMRVAEGSNGGGADVYASPGPSTSTAQRETVYSRKLADRQYSRNIRFARQFRDFATGRTPKSPLDVHVDRYSENGDGVREKLLFTEAAQDADEIGAAGGGSGRDPGHLTRFLDRSKASRTKEAQQKTRRKLRLISLAVLSVAFAIAAAAVAWHDSVIPGFHIWHGQAVVAWLLLAAAVAPAVLLARLLMELFVRMLERGAASLGLNNVHYVLFGVTDSLKLVATVAVLEVLLLLVVVFGRWKYNQDLPDVPAAMARLQTLWLCIVIFAAVDLFKTLSCRLLSMRVNSGNLFELLRDAIDKEVVMNRLMIKRHTQDAVCTPERTAAIAEARDIPDWAVEPYLNDLYTLAKTTNKKRVTFTDYLMDLGERFQNMTEAEANESASHAAEYFWLTLRQDPVSDRLTYGDLLRVLEDPRTTAFVFAAFDIDGDGCVEEHELHTRIQKCYQERRNVALTLVDNNEVISTLQTLVGAVLHTVAVFAYLYLFGVNVRHLLISLSSVGLAFVFVFGNNLRTVYESLVFLFMIRPYQVGDCIRFNGELHWVRNFGLLTTQTSRFDGCRIWIPNMELMRSEITNLSQSGKLRVRADFEVDVHGVTPGLCEELAMRLLVMMEQPDASHLFCTDFEPLCHIEHVCNPLKYKIGLCYQLSCDGEQYSKVWEANGRVNHVVGTWLQAHNLEHCASVQPLFSYDKKKIV